MKKTLLFCIILSIFLVGCGKSYKTYSKSEKIRIVKEEEMEKYEENFKKLEAAAAKGDKKAEKEMEEWFEAIMEGIEINF